MCSETTETFQSNSRASNTEVSLVGDVRSGTEVCGNTNTLKDLGESTVGFWAGDTEVVGACGDWLCAGSGQSRSQEADMGSLLRCDFGEAETNEVGTDDAMGTFQ